MERCVWRARVLPGKEAEYKKRHDEIWPEMREALKNAGVANYSIWLSGQDLFGYYECERGKAFAAEAQAASPVVKRWSEYMKDVMVMEKDPVTGARLRLDEVFYLE